MVSGQAVKRLRHCGQFQSCLLALSFPKELGSLSREIVKPSFGLLKPVRKLGEGLLDLIVVSFSVGDHCGVTDLLW